MARPVRSILRRGPIIIDQYLRGSERRRRTAQLFMGLVTTSLRTSCAARVQGRALQRGRHTRTATRTTRVAKEAMAGTDDAGDGRDGRRRGVLDKRLDKLRSEGRDVKTTGGALARRGVLVSAGRYARPPTWCEVVARGVTVARGARRSGRSGEKTGGCSDRSGRCRDAMGCSGQRDGALRLSKVGSGHGRGDKISHSRWHRPQ